MLLSHLVPSLSVWNVWDLPAWAWPRYADMHDDYAKRAKEANDGG